MVMMEMPHLCHPIRDYYVQDMYLLEIMYGLEKML